MGTSFCRRLNFVEGMVIFRSRIECFCMGCILLKREASKVAGFDGIGVVVHGVGSHGGVSLLRWRAFSNWMSSKLMPGQGADLARDWIGTESWVCHSMFWCAASFRLNCSLGEGGRWLMKKGVQWIYDRMWLRDKHPYVVLEETISPFIAQGRTVLEHGCGYTAPLLRRYMDRGANLIGADVVEFVGQEPGLTLYNADIGALPLESNSVDLVFSRSVMEHVVEPGKVFRETHRVLKPGGSWVFLTANRWDYVSVIARLVPNRFHGKLVHQTEGRAEKDVFPTTYRSNSYPQIQRWANESNLSIERFEYLGQHPQYFQFSTVCYGVASIYEKFILAVPGCRFVRGWLLVQLTKSG